MATMEKSSNGPTSKDAKRDTAGKFKFAKAKAQAQAPAHTSIIEITDDDDDEGTDHSKYNNNSIHFNEKFNDFLKTTFRLHRSYRSIKIGGKNGQEERH